MKNINDIRFNFIPFKDGMRYWSPQDLIYKTAYSARPLCMIDPNTPYPSMNLSIKEVVEELGKSKYTDKARMGVMQIFDLNHFAYKEKDGFDKWNGCTHIDLDLYHNDWFDGLPTEKKNELKVAISDALLFDANDNFLYLEWSSRMGMHLLFFYDVEHTGDNFKRCTEYTHDLIYKVFCGVDERMKEVLDTSKVFDSVSARLYQKIYLTGKGCVIGNPNGYIPEKELHEGEAMLNSTYGKDNIFNKTYNVGKVTVLEPTKAPPYIEHDIRRKLYISLSKIFDENELKKQWERCANMMVEANGHNRNYYLKCPTINDWDRMRRNGGFEDFNIYTDILEMFGYKVELKCHRPKFDIDDLLYYLK